MKSKESQEYIKKLIEPSTPYTVVVSGITLRIDYGVYPPGDLGELFNNAIMHPDYGIKPSQVVLDYGTGSGLLAILAAQRGAQVIGTDISEYAIQCAALNVRVNGWESKIEIRQGDSFSQIHQDEKFDLILASLPWENADPNPAIPMEQAFYDSGFKMRRELFSCAKAHLKTNGHIFFPYSKRAQEIEPIEKHIKEEYTSSIIAEAEIDDEPHYIMDIRPR